MQDHPEFVPPRRTVTFESFEVDLSCGKLRKHGRPVRLQLKPSLVLAALLARPGQIVTREELRAALWAGDTHVEFDSGLNTAVRKVRRALGDSAAEARFIQTISGVGYRFVAPVTERPAMVPPTARPTAPVISARARSSSPIQAVTRAAALVLLSVLGASIGEPVARAESRIVREACQFAAARQPALALTTIERGLARREAERGWPSCWTRRRSTRAPPKRSFTLASASRGAATSRDR